MDLLIILVSSFFSLIVFDNVDQKVLNWFQVQTDEMAKKRGIDNIQLATFSAWLFPILSLVLCLANCMVEDLSWIYLTLSFISITFGFVILLLMLDKLKGLYKQDNERLIKDPIKERIMIISRRFCYQMIFVGLTASFYDPDLVSVYLVTFFPALLMFYFLSCRPSPKNKVRVTLREKINDWFKVLVPVPISIDK